MACATAFPRILMMCFVLLAFTIKVMPAFSIVSTTVTMPICPRPFLPVPVARGTPGQIMVKCDAMIYFPRASCIYMTKQNDECSFSTGATADQELNNDDHSCSKTGCCENFK